MQKNPNEISNPLSGERFVFGKGAGDPDAPALEFDFWVAPGGGVPMSHCHTRQEEVFTCVSGRLEVTVNGVEQTLEAGQEVRLPPGTLHSLVNRSEEECHCRVAYLPAGLNEEWLRIAFARPMRDGRDAGLLEIAPFLVDVDMAFGGMPKWFQRTLFPFAAWLGRLLGADRRLLAVAEEVYGRPIRWEPKRR